MPPRIAPAARSHIRTLFRTIEPLSERLVRRCRAVLRKRGFASSEADALLELAPLSGVRLGGFFQRADAAARRLANLNVPPERAIAALEAVDSILGDALQGKFAPAREQLHLATVQVLNEAYYRVREIETRCFFGLYRAESEAEDLTGLLQRYVRVLVQAFGARSGRLVLSARSAEARLGGRNASYPMGPDAEIQLVFRGTREWLPRERILLEAAAERCRKAIERVRLQAEVRRLQAEARRAEDEERRRIGRELHDETGQMLLSLRLQLEMAERQATGGLREHLADARGITERAIVEVRRIIAALSPSVLERLGLKAALRHLAERFRKVHGADLRLSVAAGQELSLSQQQVIYRVAQEALQNVAKHSHAKQVKISLKSADKTIRLRVTDNGAGFNTNTVERLPMSFGLAGMRERAALLGGTLEIQSVPGEGATITLMLPKSA